MDAELTPIAKALGRIPTGLYLVTIGSPAGSSAAPMGFVGSFVMQVGFEPPTVCVAIGRDRDHLEAIRQAGHFGISILDADSQGLMGAFFRKYEAGEGPFDQLEWNSAPGGSPVFPSSLAWMEAKFTGEYDAGDHIVIFGSVGAASCEREADPSIHLRKNGLSY